MLYEERQLENMWRSFADKLKVEAGEDAYLRWFKPIKFVNFRHDIAKFLVPNAIFSFWIESNYLDVLRKVFFEQFGRSIEFQFLCSSEKESQNDVFISKTAAKTPPNLASSSKKNRQQIPVTGRASYATRKSNTRSFARNLNKRYSFKSYVRGSEYEFAFATAMSAAKNPGKKFNPIFYYGEPGVGKTHLAQAIGQEMLKNENDKVFYLSAEQFANEFISAIQLNRLAAFRRRYRRANAIIIDDVQFLAGKEKSMEEFFHTFNALMDRRKQIILTCDKAPSETPALAKRLVSRFEWGVTVTLPAPSLETRAAILLKKAQDWDIKIDDKMATYIASRIQSNARKLEGALLRLSSYLSLNNAKMSRSKLDSLLRDLYERQIKELDCQTIAKKICAEFSLHILALRGNGRDAKTCLARQMAMSIARKKCALSLKAIADYFGKKDHSAVLQAEKALQKKFTKDEAIERLYEQILADLR